MSKMIDIIDYDMGNLASIKNMLHKIGCNDVIISREKEDILGADKLILPGVGAFEQGVKNLKRFDLFDAIKEAVERRRTPILGICLGMQLLGRKSEEGNPIDGLSLIPFDTIRFRLNPEYKIPHMGWNDVKIAKCNALVQGLDEGIQRFYFVHSYHAKCDDESDILMTCNYGYDFAAAVSRGNVYGVQFHPEKSHMYGMNLLKNYVEM